MASEQGDYIEPGDYIDRYDLSRRSRPVAVPLNTAWDEAMRRAGTWTRSEKLQRRAAKLWWSSLLAVVYVFTVHPPGWLHKRQSRADSRWWSTTVKRGTLTIKGFHTGGEQHGC